MSEQRATAELSGHEALELTDVLLRRVKFRTETIAKKCDSINRRDAINAIAREVEWLQDDLDRARYFIDLKFGTLEVADE